MSIMTKSQLKTFFLAFVALLVLFPQHARATEFRVESQRSEVKVGEPFLVMAVISSQESLNVVGGQLVFPSEALKVIDIQDGNSVINFWIEKPEVTRSGVIEFSGV